MTWIWPPLSLGTHRMICMHMGGVTFHASMVRLISAELLGASTMVHPKYEAEIIECVRAMLALLMEVRRCSDGDASL